jgi:hypothetical protein
MATMKWKVANPASKVEGRVLCHKCQLACSTAEHYLSHKCETPSLNLAMARRFAAQEASNESRGQSARRAISA